MPYLVKTGEYKMTQWYVKELSQLTQISVQTLHHYDRIGLLKPSSRLANGYRIYSEQDLSKLQQIIALKFFGFELSQIQTILSDEVDLINNLAAQAQCLAKKGKTLIEASQDLKNIIFNCSNNRTIPWQTIIDLIDIYRRTEQLENAWEGKVFTPEELKDYARFEQNITKERPESLLKEFNQAWMDLVKVIDTNLDKAPDSDFGKNIGKRCMDWVNAYYGKEHASLRNTIWEKGLKKGEIDHEGALSPESYAWLEQAINSYYRERILTVLNQVDITPAEHVLEQWDELLHDMHGGEQAPKNEIMNTLLNDKDISKSVKNWLKNYIRGSKK